MASSQTLSTTSLTLPPAASPTRFTSAIGRSKMAKLRAGDCRVVADASRGAVNGSLRAPRRSPTASGTTSASRRPTPTNVCTWLRAIPTGLGRRDGRGARRRSLRGPHSGTIASVSGDSDSEPNSIRAPLMPSASAWWSL